MDPEQRAQIEERVADVEEATEQRLHAVAPKLPDPERVHKTADQLTEQATEHFHRAEQAREQPAS